MFRQLFSLSLFVFILCATVDAGEVILKNGDRISGTILSSADEAIEIQTSYAGVIRIERAHIAKVSEKAPNEIEKTSTTEVDDKSPSADATPVDEAAEASATPRRGMGRRFASFVEGWEGNANIGFSFTSGNSNNTTMATGLRAFKSVGNDKLNVYFRSLWNSNRGSGRMITTQNAFWGGGRYDRKIHRKTFGFVSYDFERDRPKNLNFRSVAGGGFGYHFVRTDRTEIDVLGGAAWNRTWLPGTNTDTPESLVGTTLKRKLNDRLRFQNSFTYFQNLMDAATYRFLFDASLTADVTKRIGIFVTVGDRFNNDPVGNAKKNDFLFTTGLKWNFGKKK
ncbi:MAG TPA: DUF481 domain-containing protein [Pyrinomonadaceae bacterium]|nr:DUF481 domain-containing protein [Pyrinomonadaceae bacterium]